MLGTASRPLFARTQVAQTIPRFSCMLWTLQKLASFDRSLEIVAQAGFQGVELVGEFQKWSPEETRRNLTRLQSLNLVVDSMSGVKTGFADPTQSAQFLSEFEQHLH